MKANALVPDGTHHLSQWAADCPEPLRGVGFVQGEFWVVDGLQLVLGPLTYTYAVSGVPQGHVHDLRRHPLKLLRERCYTCSGSCYVFGSECLDGLMEEAKNSAILGVRGSPTERTGKHHHPVHSIDGRRRTA